MTREQIQSQIDTLIPTAENGEQWAEICRLEALLFPEEAETCPDCGGLTSGGMTVDPDKCCFTCKAD